MTVSSSSAAAPQSSLLAAVLVARQGLVLFNSFKKFVVVKDNAGKVVIDLGEFFLGFFYDSVCSPALGLAVGILAAVVFKWADMRDTKLLELSLFVLIMYVPFLVAEMLDLSGIVTILFTGMTARAYVVPNLSDETAENANTLFRLAAHLAETSIFLELGLSAFGMKGSVYGTFIGWCLVACLLGRALNVYPIVYLYNQYLRQHGGQHERLDTSQNDNRQRMSSSNHEQPDSVEMTTMQSRSHDSADSTSRSMDCPLSQDDSQDTADLSHFRGMVKDDLEISWNTAHMLWFSGLRGAVAYACVRSFPDTFHHQEIFTVTTMCIVLVTVFGLGSTTESTLNLLRIEMDVNEDQYMEVWHQEQSEDGLIVSVEERLKQYAIRTTTPIAIHAEDDHDTSMAPGEASIATGFRHHRDADGAVGTDPSLHHRGRRKPGDSVFDFGKR
jgi:NhaP-type Na+/H+ or K+/H+ antiporter